MQHFVYFLRDYDLDQESISVLGEAELKNTPSQMPRVLSLLENPPTLHPIKYVKGMLFKLF